MHKLPRNYDEVQYHSSGRSQAKSDLAPGFQMSQAVVLSLQNLSSAYTSIFFWTANVAVKRKMAFTCLGKERFCREWSMVNGEFYAY